MRVVILAGGKGTRLSEETSVIPKPMVEIGGEPIIEHIMQIYESQGFSDFLIVTGYKGAMITAHFMDGSYEWKRRENSVFFSNGKRTIETVFTGVNTQTGGRLRRVAHLLEEPFLLTYGDGVGNIRICNVLNIFERNQTEGNLVTITAVHPPPRFGSVVLRGNEVTYFGEKVGESNQWINGGFMVVDPKALTYISYDHTNWEKDVLPDFSRRRWMTAYKHEGFWRCMDSLRDKEELENIMEHHGKLWIRK